MNETDKAVVLCPCGFDDVVIAVKDNDHLCADCRETRDAHGWCMGEAAQYRNDYGDDWTVAQASCQRARIEQPARKHSRGWR